MRRHEIRHRRRLAVGFAALLLSVLAIPPAGADLQLVEIQSDIPFGGATDLALSADGEEIYVVSFHDRAVVALRRGPSERLELVDAAIDADLRAARGVAASPDGAQVYACGQDALVRFERSATGELTAAETLASGSDDWGR